jgi:hypothetical protein
MALNPAFASASTHKLPLAFGYVLGAGDQVLSTTATDGSQYALFLLGEAEWDGPEMMSTFPATSAAVGGAVPAHLVDAAAVVPYAQTFTTGVYLNSHTQAPWFDYPGFQWGIPSMHFHSGSYTPIGTVVPTVDPITGAIPTNASQSVGPDQGYDAWFSQFPSVTPPQSFSGMSYVIFCVPGNPANSRGVTSGQTINGVGLWRTTRCRIFDAYGNVVSYGFTCNPAWHKVEAILRYKIRPQQPPIGGLTDEEKACFDWPSIVELAARNDYILANGNPRFVGNYIFAADSTLANMMETMCRVDRSYQRVDGGKIYLIGDDARSSVFQASAKHLVPNSLKLDKKDVSKSPNQFVPSYRDIDIPAVAEVVSFTRWGMWSYRDGEAWGLSCFTCKTPTPFANNSFLRYGGGAHPELNGVYPVWLLGNNGDPYPIGENFPNNTYSANTLPEGTPQPTYDNIGGYLGSDDARFSQRAPTNVQHRSAQRMVARQAPGLAVQPTVRKVVYDCGNSTFDQTNRLMKFERDRSLGPDTGAGWTAPICGTLSLYYECVDANGERICDRRVHNVVSIDDWLSPEFAGEYEITQIQISAPTQSSLGQIDLSLISYYPTAPTDVSDDPGNYYKIVPNTTLQLTGFTPVANPAWVLQSTLQISADASGDGRLTIAIPDLSMQILGKTSPTSYPQFSVSGIPPSTPVALYVIDPSGTGTSATYGFVAGVAAPALTGWQLSLLFNGTLIPYTYPLPAGAMLVASGTWIAP